MKERRWRGQEEGVVREREGEEREEGGGRGKRKRVCISKSV